jgi:hypothetical protein
MIVDNRKPPFFRKPLKGLKPHTVFLIGMDIGIEPQTCKLNSESSYPIEGIYCTISTAYMKE